MFRAVWNGAVLAESGHAVKVEGNHYSVVRVYWRPGCPFCAMLRLGLRSARVRAEWANIWDDRPPRRRCAPSPAATKPSPP
ncbi:MAG: glutaredoxin domain-containing protein, partial [Streptosporangiaceae bacterium]